MRTRLMTRVLSAAVMITPMAFGESGDMPKPQDMKAITKKVADWQIATFAEHGKYRALPSKKRKQWRNDKNYHDLTWHMGALCVGMDQWRKVADNPQKYVDFLKMVGERNEWKLHKRPYHADDHAVGQFYLSLYQDQKDPKMLAPTRKHFDWILANPKTGSLTWGINNGLLDRKTYEPIVLKGWSALTKCVTPEGMLGWVLPVGAAPGESFADATDVYGIGAFLAAGSEVCKLGGGK